MRRFFLLVLAACLFSASAMANENVRAVQTKLKEGGFYFGEVNGEFSSDLSAAVTRFQIRQGLQITGKVDEKTSRALGVKYEVAGPNAAPASDTWRQLRKSDQRLLTRANPKESRPAPAPHSRDFAVAKNGSTSAKPTNPTAVLAPEPTGDGSTFTLSPERLRDYVGAFVLAGIDPILRRWHGGSREDRARFAALRRAMA